MRKTYFLAVTLLALGAAFVAGADLVEDSDLSVYWAGTEPFTAQSVLRSAPMYNPSIPEGEVKSLWVRAYNNRDQTRNFEAQVDAGPCLEASPKNLTMGNIPGKSEGGMKRLRVKGTVPDGEDSCSSEINITLVADGEPVKNKIKPVKIASQ